MLLMCAFCGAMEDDGQVNIALAKIPTEGRWEVAPEVSWYRYREPGLMENEGVLYGIGASYTQPREKGFWRLEGVVSAGHVDYDGALQDGTPYRMSNSRDWLLGLRLLGEYPWQVKEWESRLFAGIGYRFLSDDSSSDPAGYERASNYFYLPLGLRGSRPWRNGWDIGLGGEFDLLLVGVQVSDVGEHPPQTNVQWPGFGTRVSFEMRHRDGRFDLAVSPFLQYWWVDESNESSEGWYEPENNTLQVGLSAIWRF
jgi:hypothetical protein